MQLLLSMMAKSAVDAAGAAVVLLVRLARLTLPQTASFAPPRFIQRLAYELRHPSSLLHTSHL